MTHEEFAAMKVELGTIPSEDAYDYAFRIANAAEMVGKVKALKVIRETYVNHRGASVQTAFPEDAKILLDNMARVLGEIEYEVRES